MTRRIYIENAVKKHPRTQAILKRYPKAEVIACGHYQEVFNPKHQNFREQKKEPALILAEKKGSLVLPTPLGHGIGGDHHHYFSHLLNCPFDCRYCFLQGMYASANYVLFVNYEDFHTAIQQQCAAEPDKQCIYFAGYDADALALEPITGFMDYFIPAFKNIPNAWLELRTKSANLKALNQHQAHKRIIIAMSLTPEIISQNIEHKVAPMQKRLAALKACADAGWPIGLRFDPVILFEGWETHYKALFESVFSLIPPEQRHSVSTGPLRYPHQVYTKIKNLYPDDGFMATPLHKGPHYVAYPPELEEQAHARIRSMLSVWIDDARCFHCLKPNVL